MRAFEQVASKLIKPGLGLAVVLLGLFGSYVYRAAPSRAANALLHPSRRSVDAAVRDTFPATRFAGANVMLSGWRVPAAGDRRGVVIYLHGVADNRGSAIAVARRLSQQGFEVIAYDSRAHGESEGDVCTYGFYEKADLRRVLDTITAGPIVVIGSSLGAAVALQAAAEDRRIDAVVAAESFSDLRTVAAERAPWFLAPSVIARTFAAAETQGAFTVDDVSPVRAARRIAVPVLLLHGAADRETPPAHSERIFDALAGPKRLMLVEGAGHNQSLGPQVWSSVIDWIDGVLPRPPS
jgi:alpha-beta hydrolase superfamily lysophospholipase